MKKSKKLISLLLVFIMTFTSSITIFAKDFITENSLNTVSQSNSILIVDEGIYINNIYYTKEQFKKLLDTAIKVESEDSDSKNRSITLVAGTWWIPGVGKVIITAVGVIFVGDMVVKAGSWIYDTVTNWFAERERTEIAEVSGKIPQRLKNENGNVNIGNFNQKVNGKTAYKEKGGWTIEKDNAGHGGREWKLKDKSGNRVASLDGKGKVLSK